MITEHKLRDEQRNSNNLSKIAEFYQRLEQKQANQAEIKEEFPFLNKKTYKALRVIDKWVSQAILYR